MINLTAGDQVTVEMHQQPADRSCATQAIGGDHYGPINVTTSLLRWLLLALTSWHFPSEDLSRTS